MRTRVGELCVVECFCCSCVLLGLHDFAREVFTEGDWERLGWALVLVSCVFVECFCCIFVDVGFKEFCMGGVRGRGLGALPMSTRVGELCVVERCSLVYASFKEFCMRRVRGRGGWERVGAKCHMVS